MVFASARQEHSRSISGWHVEGAALCVVDVLAIVRVRYGIITGLEAELAASEEIVPVRNLSNSIVVLRSW